MVKPVLISIIETHVTENTTMQRKENILLYVIVFNYLSDMNTESYKNAYGRNSAKGLKESV